MKRTFCLLLCFVLLVAPTTCEGTSCETDGTCSAAEEEIIAEEKSPSGNRFCTKSGPRSLYANGGSAQAYTAEAPVSSEVCTKQVTEGYPFRSASWPFTRRSTSKGSAPILDISLKLWSCNDDCSCKEMTNNYDRGSSFVEVWQARPDGTYSSLRPKEPDAKECRAQVPVEPKTGVARFTTVAPGSTGIFYGLGPGRFEFAPFGPPVIHLLARVPGHEALLIDLPALLRPKTLESRKGALGDLRGLALVRKKPEKMPFHVTSWISDVEANQVQISVDVYLTPSSTDRGVSDEPPFCESIVYGLPSSFFLEPIAICAPWMLDFMTL